MAEKEGVQPLHKYKTQVEQNAFLKDQKRQINSLLKQGYHIDANKSRIRDENAVTGLPEI